MEAAVEKMQSYETLKDQNMVEKLLDENNIKHYAFQKLAGKKVNLLNPISSTKQRTS